VNQSFQCHDQFQASHDEALQLTDAVRQRGPAAAERRSFGAQAGDKTCQDRVGSSQFSHVPLPVGRLDAKLSRHETLLPKVVR
jgi:hypothetical protein